MSKKDTLFFKNIFGGVVGNIMEWYDFAVFGFLAPIITIHFFPNDTPLTGLIMTYGVFATGYMMRPFGGVFFGFIGDKLGRKKALLISMFLMALPTVIIGFLPTYEEIGIYAALILILLRMIQGLSVGGELIGSVSYIVEISSQKQKGFFGSLTLAGAVGGLVLGSGSVAVLELILGKEAMYEWGWRVPFLAGVVILFIGLWLREKMSESPEFLKLKHEEDFSPLKSVIKNKKLKILHLSMMISLATVSTYILFVWIPTYLSDIIKNPFDDALSFNTISMIVLFISILISGYLSDIYGRLKIMMFATIAMILFVYPLFGMLQDSRWEIVLSAQLLFAVIVGFIQGPMPSLMAEMFETNIRYTSIGIGYNFSVAVLGGTAPIIATWLMEISDDVYFVSYYITFVALISLVALFFTSSSKKLEEKVKL